MNRDDSQMSHRYLARMSLDIPSEAAERLAFPRETGSTWTPRAGVGHAVFERPLLALISAFRSPFVARFYAGSTVRCPGGPAIV
jgi:hypothetical protein